jgi:hypothetical protein
MSAGVCPAETAAGATAAATAAAEISASRRRLTRDGAAISAYALPVGLVFGLTALQAHYSLADVIANCMIVLAGVAQFAAAGLVKDGASWLAVNCLLSSDKPGQLLLGIEPAAVLVCALIVARTRPLLPGVAAAVVLVAVAREAGVG